MCLPLSLYLPIDLSRSSLSLHVYMIHRYTNTVCYTRNASVIASAYQCICIDIYTCVHVHTSTSCACTYIQTYAYVTHTHTHTHRKTCLNATLGCTPIVLRPYSDDIMIEDSDRRRKDAGTPLCRSNTRHSPRETGLVWHESMHSRGAVPCATRCSPREAWRGLLFGCARGSAMERSTPASRSLLPPPRPPSAVAAVLLRFAAAVALAVAAVVAIDAVNVPLMICL